MADTILVVDDDVDVAEAVERTLRRSGFDVLVAYRGADAIEMARRQHPAVVVLDIVMPGMSGIDVCRHMRASMELAGIPILFLTARAEISDKIEGYTAGADDYLTKPFDLRELELRIKAVLRRSQNGGTSTSLEEIRVGALCLNTRTFEVSTPEVTELLTPVEFEMMQFLMTNPDHVFSADELLQNVWGYPPGTGMPDLVRVHIKNVRDKIEPKVSEPKYLRNILRRGYLVSSDTL
jgi:two-component system, OmpR family, response regulator RpaA